MNTLQCFLATFEAIAQAMLLVGIGILLTRMEFITSAGRKTLSNVALNALTPCLLLSKVAGHPDMLGLLEHSWILLLLPVVIVCIGALIGWIIAVFTRSPNNFWKACIGMVTFANSNSLAVVLLELLGPPFQRAGIITQDPTVSLSVYLVFYPMLEWTAGAYLFGLFDDKKETGQKDAKGQDSEAAASTEDMLQVEIEDIEQSRCTTCFSTFCSGLWKIVSSGLQPPVIAVLIGMVIALVPPLQGLFVASKPDASAPLGFVYNVIYQIGQAMPPISMFILASNLSQGADRHAIPMATNLGIMLGKMAILPAVMIWVVYGLSRVVGRTNSTSDWLVALVVSCTPSANKIMIMVELSGQNKGGVTLSILTQYIAAPLVLTGMLTLFATLLNSEWYLPH
eukprot:TRINITY_DN64373_c0_g1_i1.p1 TRINITY_DN64373_c0_g1~~TRINITY_DN64373_c0_g1_i1.p1  ORF type:complete len:396 (-),score=57.96 TRINITY_DN64373_c0_g1_i1:43-1230(-)